MDPQTTDTTESRNEGRYPRYLHQWNRFTTIRGKLVAVRAHLDR